MKLPIGAAWALRDGLNLAFYKIESGEFAAAADMLTRCSRMLRRAAKQAKRIDAAAPPLAPASPASRAALERLLADRISATAEQLQTNPAAAVAVAANESSNGSNNNTEPA